MESDTLVQHSLVGQPYGYTAADLSTLKSTEYTLVVIGVDESSSVSGYKKEMEDCLQEIIDACKMSPKSDSLLLRIVAFNSRMREIHGFKQLADCQTSDYADCLRTIGSTMLFGTAQNIISSTHDYGKQLVSEEYLVNAIVFLITDGDDNASGSIGAVQVGEALGQIGKEESLESILSILVGVGTSDYPDLNDYLNTFKDEAKLSKYVEIGDANKSNLAKLADFVSKSISSQSQSLGTGQSQLLEF